MLRIYTAQLASLDIDYAAIPVPPKPAPSNSAGDGNDEYAWRWHARELARRSERTKRDADRRAANPPRVILDGGRFGVTFEYDAALVAAIKTAIPYNQRSWNSARKMWVVELPGAAALARFVEEHDFEVEAQAQPVLAAALALAANEVPAAELPQVRMEDDAITVRFPYDEGLVARFKRNVPLAKWDKPNLRWMVGLEMGPAVVKWAKREKLTIAAEVTEAAGFEEVRQETMRAASRAGDAEGFEVELPEGLALRPFQRGGVAYALVALRTFIADEMGLGKTVQALVALEAANAYPALIVVPNRVKLNWLREAGKWLPHRKAVALSGIKPDPAAVEGADLIFVNYEIASKWLPGLPAVLGGFGMDESQNCKNDARVRREAGAPRGTRQAYKTQQVEACWQIANRVRPDGVRLALSGTPLVNRPRELVAQLDILGRLDEFGGAFKFLVRYCGGQKDEDGRWNFSGASHLQELNDRLRQMCYVRRLKVDVMPELPPRQFLPLVVPRSELDAAVMKEYVAAEDDVCSVLADRAAELAREVGGDPNGAAVEARMRAEAARHLVTISVLRQLAAKAKLPYIKGWVTDFQESTGRKIVLMGHHRTVVDDLAATFRAVKIQGGMSIAASQESADRFQTEDSVRTIACAVKAGGVGITLTQAKDVLFAERDWTPAGEDQALDRVHRIGQEGEEPCTGWLTIAEGTIDVDMDELVEAKRKVVTAATDGGKVEKSASVVGDVLMRLVRRGLERRKRAA